MNFYNIKVEPDGKISLRDTGDTLGYLNGGYRKTPSVNVTGNGVYVYVGRGFLGLKTYKVDSLEHGILALLQLYSDRLRSRYSGLIRKLVLAMRTHNSGCIDENRVCRLIYRNRGCVRNGFRVALALAIYVLSRYNVSRSSLDPDITVLVNEGIHEIKSPLGLYATTALSIVKTLSCNNRDLEWITGLVKMLSDRARDLVLNGRLGTRLIDLLEGERGLTESILALLVSIGKCGGRARVLLHGPQQHVSPIVDAAPLLGIREVIVDANSAIESIAACTASYIRFKPLMDKAGEECLALMEPVRSEWKNPKGGKGIIIGKPETLVSLTKSGIVDISYYGGNIATTGRLAALRYDRGADEIEVVSLKEPRTGFDAVTATRSKCTSKKRPYTTSQLKRIIYRGSCFT